jgi:hypothetical protein
MSGNSNRQTTPLQLNNHQSQLGLTLSKTKTTQINFKQKKKKKKKKFTIREPLQNQKPMRTISSTDRDTIEVNKAINKEE